MMNTKVTKEGLETTVALAEVFVPGDMKRGYEFVSIGGNIFTYIINPQKNDRDNDDHCTIIAKIDLLNTTEWQQANICQMINRRIISLFKRHKVLSDEMNIDTNQTYMLRTIKYSKEPVH